MPQCPERMPCLPPANAASEPLGCCGAASTQSPGAAPSHSKSPPTHPTPHIRKKSLENDEDSPALITVHWNPGSNSAEGSYTVVRTRRLPSCPVAQPTHLALLGPRSPTAGGGALLRWKYPADPVWFALGDAESKIFSRKNRVCGTFISTKTMYEYQNT